MLRYSQKTLMMLCITVKMLLHLHMEPIAIFWNLMSMNTVSFLLLHKKLALLFSQLLLIYPAQIFWRSWAVQCIKSPQVI